MTTMIETPVRRTPLGPVPLEWLLRNGWR